MNRPSCATWECFVCKPTFWVRRLIPWKPIFRPILRMKMLKRSECCLMWYAAKWPD